MQLQARDRIVGRIGKKPAPVADHYDYAAPAAAAQSGGVNNAGGYVSGQPGPSSGIEAVR